MIITSPQSGRLDKILVKELTSMTRNQISLLIKGGHIQVNQSITKKTGHKIKSGDTITVTIPQSKKLSLKPLKAPLDIVYESNDYLIINKSPFLPVHPSHGHPDDTLVNILAYYYPKFKDFDPINNTLRPGIVHRLDMNTSGLIVVAKNQTTLNQFQQDIKDKKWQKTYLAWTLNNSQKGRGVIKKNIIRHPKHRQKFTATNTNQGKTALTRYKVIKNFEFENNTLSLLEIQIETGRTHQIRVHLLHENLPILGDELYQTKDSKIIGKILGINRQLLHAGQLTIIDPQTKRSKSFTSPTPSDFDIKK